MDLLGAFSKEREGRGRVISRACKRPEGKTIPHPHPVFYSLVAGPFAEKGPCFVFFGFALAHEGPLKRGSREQQAGGTEDVEDGLLCVRVCGVWCMWCGGQVGNLGHAR